MDAAETIFATALVERAFDPAIRPLFEGRRVQQREHEIGHIYPKLCTMGVDLGQAQDPTRGGGG